MCGQVKANAVIGWAPGARERRWFLPPPLRAWGSRSGVRGKVAGWGLWPAGQNGPSKRVWQGCGPRARVSQLCRRSLEVGIFIGNPRRTSCKHVNGPGSQRGAWRVWLAEPGRRGDCGVFRPWPLLLHCSLPMPSVRGDPRPKPPSMAGRSSKLCLPSDSGGAKSVVRVPPGDTKRWAPAQPPQSQPQEETNFTSTFVSLTNNARGIPWGALGALAQSHPHLPCMPGVPPPFLGMPVPRWQSLSRFL